MLSGVKGAAPQGAKLESLLTKPCNHMARLVRDLCEPSAVGENLKDVLKFIKDVRSPDSSMKMYSISCHPSEGDRCSVRWKVQFTPHCRCQSHTVQHF